MLYFPSELVLEAYFFALKPALAYLRSHSFRAPEIRAGIRNPSNHQSLFIGGTTMRTKITLACTECKQRNYDTTKDKKTMPDRMEIKKYCRFCKKHTLHKETK
jgi:large subunit ribosomal protein L33